MVTPLVVWTPFVLRSRGDIVVLPSRLLLTPSARKTHPAERKASEREALIARCCERGALGRVGDGGCELRVGYDVSKGLEGLPAPSAVARSAQGRLLVDGGGGRGRGLARGGRAWRVGRGERGSRLMEEGSWRSREGGHLARNLVDPLLSVGDETALPLECDGVVAAGFAPSLVLEVISLRRGSHISDSGGVGLPQREEPSQREHARLVLERERWGEGGR